MKRKKGSSLLVVVAMFAMLSILIMSVLAMTTASYSMRIKNNRRIENFYAADSGLEISKKLVYDLVNEAINKSAEKVNSINDITEKEGLFKYYFIEYFRETINGDIRLKSEIEKKDNYIEYFGNEINDIEISLEVKKTNIIYNDEYKNIDINNDNGSTEIKSFYEIGSIQNKNYKKYYISKGNIFFNIMSRFKDKNNNERNISIDGKVDIPNYTNGIVSSKILDTNILNYIIAADGNYTLETENTVDVYGDIWVKGNSSNTNSINSNNKYNGGINISSKILNPEVSWKGNIITASTLNISNVILKVALDSYKIGEKNIYAKNMVITNSTDNTIKTMLGEKTNLYLYNDFVLNGIKNKITLKNFYGLNDINYYEDKNKDINIDNLSEAERSSSMIINSNDFGDSSSINILNDAFILGTSYLDLNGFSYQTGQSNVIRGISRPYTFRGVDKDGKSYIEKYIYDYKGNMHIIDEKKMDNGENKKLDLNDKIDIVLDYYNNMSEEDKKIANGMSARTLVNAGAVLANGKLNEPNIPMDIDNKNFDKLFEEYQSKFAKEVFNMGKNGDYNRSDFWNNTVNNTVENSINWDKISDLAQKNYNNHDSLNRIEGNGNANDFICLSTKSNINTIMNQAYNETGERHPLASYGYSNTVIGNKNPYIILSSSNKDIRIEKVNNEHISFTESTDEIIFNIPKSQEIKPLIIISKGNIICNNFNGNNYFVFISAKDINCNVSSSGVPAIIGNYLNQSNASVESYESGQYKLLNELFKYVLDRDNLAGEVGKAIFKGEEHHIINGIKLSDVIKFNNWDLKR